MNRIKWKRKLKTCVCCAAFVLSLLFLHACTGQPQSADTGAQELNRQELHAVVLERMENGLLVEPEEGSPERRSSDKLVAGASQAKLYDELGNAIGLTEFREGDRVRVVYDGAIQETYPAQLATCYEIHRVSQAGEKEQTTK